MCIRDSKRHVHIIAYLRGSLSVFKMIIIWQSLTVLVNCVQTYKINSTIYTLWSYLILSSIICAKIRQSFYKRLLQIWRFNGRNTIRMHQLPKLHDCTITVMLTVELFRKHFLLCVKFLSLRFIYFYLINKFIYF